MKGFKPFIIYNGLQWSLGENRAWLKKKTTLSVIRPEWFRVVIYEDL
jgi:hypothetical protein